MTAAAIARALEMSVEERRERWQALMGRLRANGIADWCRDFLAALHGDQPVVPDRGGRRDPSRSRAAHVSS
jgi:trehalose 6-phosphate synthase